MNKQDLAKKLYDAYNDAVGGVAWNGDKLPGSEEFFKDETKSKQSLAWVSVAEFALGLSDFNSPKKAGDKVNFFPTTQQAKKLGIEEIELTGTIVAVRFTEDEVFFDVLSSYYGIVFEGLPESKIYDYTGKPA